MLQYALVIILVVIGIHLLHSKVADWRSSPNFTTNGRKSTLHRQDRSGSTGDLCRLPGGEVGPLGGEGTPLGAALDGTFLVVVYGLKATLI